MPYCPECGKPVSPNAKFCRNCGSSQLEENPVPAASPVPAPPELRTCTTCQAPLKPDEKFCGNCGKPVDAPAVPPQAPPAPEPAPKPAAAPEVPAQPAPQPAPAPSPGRVCSSCGSTVDAETKFCGNCGKPANATPAPQAPPAPAAAPEVPVQPAPQPAPAPAPSPGRVCGSCGHPVSAETKFCGNCGKPVNATVPAPQAPSQPAPQPAPVPVPPPARPPAAAVAAVPPVAPAPAPQAPPVPPAAAPAAQNEKVIGVIANARKPKMLGVAWDTYNLVVTDRRVIMAQLTQQMAKDAVAEAQAKAKAQGKGFFGIMADQMSAMFQYAVRYENMNPETIIAETPGNFALENSQIGVVDLSLKGDSDDTSQYSEFKLVFKSAGGKFEFRIAEDERYINILKAAYGAKVKMPFGYHKVGALRIKFF